MSGSASVWQSKLVFNKLVTGVKELHMDKSLPFDTDVLVKVLFVIAAALVILNIINIAFDEPSWQLTRLIHLGRESNFSTWFSSAIWAIAAFLAYKCYKKSIINRLPDNIWIVLSSIFLFFSCDEVAMMHENFGDFFNRHYFKLHIGVTSWVIVLAPFIVPIMIFMFVSLWKHLAYSKHAICLILMGLGLFILGSMVLEQSTALAVFKNSVILRRAETIAEEAFEIFGSILVIKGLLAYKPYSNNR